MTAETTGTPHTQPTAYRIIALDDHPMVIEGIGHILSTLDGVSHRGLTKTAEMMQMLQQGDRFDLFILDLELPDADGFDTIASIRRHCPQAAILIYTMHQEPWMLARLAQLNLQGVVSKSNAVAVLVEAVEAIRAGGIWFDDEYLQLVKTNIGTTASPGGPDYDGPALSEREKQVLRCIVEGLSTKAIAERLYISENTVGTHRMHLMQKLGTHNVAQLISKGQWLLLKDQGKGEAAKITDKPGVFHHLNR